MKKDKIVTSEQSANKALAKIATDIIPSILDREVSDSGADAFGHRHFAEALKGLVEGPEHKPPFSIGLLGGWGTGKSSVKSMYLATLADTTGKEARSGRIKSITFNAWRFGGEDIRRALLRDVFVQLGGNESAIHDQFFSQTSSIVFQPRNLGEMLKDSWQRITWIFAQLLILFGFAILLVWIAAQVFHIDSEQYYAWLIAVFVAFSAYGFKVLEKAVVNRFTDVTKIELPKATAEQYEKLLKDHLLNWKSKDKAVERLVIFVDDLDRLSSEEMVSGLDAIRTLMELPIEKCGMGVVFVISCDEDLVAEALSKRARTAPELPGAISSRQDARRYLDRIFQFRLEIPLLPRQDMRSFAKDLLARECFAQIVGTVESAGSSVDEIVSRMIHVGVRNPRNAIQIINTFAASMWIAIKREFEGTASTKPGALAEGAVTKHPLSLAVISAIKVDFPEFYRLLQVEPGVLDGFIRIFIRGEDPNDLPGTVRSVLAQLAAGHSDITATEWQLHDKYGSLRQFVSSIQAVQFPASLQPLLLLNQDEVTRRTGDAGARLYDPIVSGDLSGVLKILGRDTDERVLTLQEVEALFNVWELVESDTPDRKENAATVLANLVSRCDPTQGRKLAVPIATTISNSSSLRSRIGLEQLRSLLPFMRESDRQSLLDTIATDFGIGDEIHLTALTDAGKAHTLEQAIAAVPGAVEALLDAWKLGDLKQITQQRLIGWMLDRNVSVSDKAKKVLPFRFLDEWVGSAETLLLPRLGVQYAIGAVAELGQKTPSLADEDAAKIRLGKVLAEADSQSDDSWNLLTRISSLGEIDLCMKAQSYARSHIGNATSNQIDVLATALAERVTRYAGKEALSEDDVDAVELLRSICAQYPAALVNAKEKIRETVIALSQVEATAGQSVSLSNSLVGVSKTEWESVMADWLARFEAHLPLECIKELGTVASKLSTDPLPTALSAGLASCIGSAEERDHIALNLFWESAEKAGAISTAALQGEVGLVLTHMTGMHPNFAASRAVWPTYHIALRCATAALAGSQLASLSAQSATVPVSYAAFMEFMGSEWSNLSKFQPLTSVDTISRTVSTIQSTGSSLATRPMLESLGKLLAVAEPTEAEQDSLVSAITRVWASHPETSTSILEKFGSRIWTDEIILIFEEWATKPDELEPFAERIIRSAMVGVEESKALELLPSILALSPLRSSNSNDCGLKFLIECLDANVARSMVSFTTDSSQTPEARLRVLERIAALDQGASVEWLESFFMACAEVGADVPSDQVASRVQKEHDETSRFTLAMSLLSGLVGSQSLDGKRAIAKVTASISGVAPSEALIKNNDISLEDVRILSDTFPNNRKILSKLNKLSK